MQRHVTLAALARLPCPPSRSDCRYSPAVIDHARAALVARNLRFDNATGVIRDRSGELERYIRPHDFTPHTTPADVMLWEFSRYILNSASRIERGFQP